LRYAFMYNRGVQGKLTTFKVRNFYIKKLL